MEEKRAVKSRFKRVCVFCGSSVKEIRSRLWRRKCWVDGLSVSGGPSWWRTCTGNHPQNSDEQRGGYGTLEELLEVITWAQLGIHDKPVGLLNVDGYYNLLLTFIDKAVDDGFIKPSQRSIIVSAPNVKELVQKLEDYVPLHDGVVAQAKWEAEQLELNASLQTEVAR
ncbi:hypothetical protein GH714_016670 [Hevea brasiliensis]|uniref:cytokinin riboside 5'-monophosphate phosphoribohydrolase n=1 Tax=Hevea brasiliensis TaxID=3981 RepID=A0A6A6NHY6_HEVBR|nr:hypothetical protein GH714_016670 [Hevea brasiliensis]